MNIFLVLKNIVKLNNNQINSNLFFNKKQKNITIIDKSTNKAEILST